MKNVLTGGAALAFLVLASGAARAQEPTVEVRIPFSFVVAHQEFPAGKYVIERTAPDVLLIHGEHGTRGSAYMLTMPDADSLPRGSKPVLTFRKDETKWRLASVDEPAMGQTMTLEGVSAGN